jgi:hypothetical protein
MYKFLSTIEDRNGFISDTKRVDKITPDLIVEQFGLNTWKAAMAPNHKEEGIGIKGSNYVYRNNIAVNGQLDSKDQGKILNPYVRDSYKIVQFSEGAKWFDYFTREGLLTIESALILDESHFGITCDMGLESAIQGEDKVNRYFILCLGHGTGTPKMLGFTDIRPVCANTLVTSAASALGKAGAAFDLASDPAVAMQKARGMIDLVNRRFHEIEVPAYREYTRIKTTTDERELFYRRLLGMPLEGWEVSDKLLSSYQRLEEAYNASPGMELFDTKEHTGWRMLQAATWAAKTFGAKTDWDKYKSRFGHPWVNKTHEWLELRMNPSVAPVKSALPKSASPVGAGV